MEKIIITDTINGDYNCANLPKKYDKPEYNQSVTFTLKHMSIINRLLYLNKALETHYKNWQNLVDFPQIDNSSNFNLLKSALKQKEWQRNLINNYYEQEEIIMHLRKTIDDCISLLSIATNCFFKDKKNNILRPFESIGECINQIGKYKIFTPHLNYLKTINAISNGFKHCIANNTMYKIGKEEPCIFVYEKNGLYYNEIGISINNLIIGFNEFYATFDSKLKEE